MTEIVVLSLSNWPTSPTPTKKFRKYQLSPITSRIFKDCKQQAKSLLPISYGQYVRENGYKFGNKQSLGLYGSEMERRKMKLEILVQVYEGASQAKQIRQNKQGYNIKLKRQSAKSDKNIYVSNHNLCNGKNKYTRRSVNSLTNSHRAQTQDSVNEQQQLQSSNLNKINKCDYQISNKRPDSQECLVISQSGSKYGYVCSFKNTHKDGKCGDSCSCRCPKDKDKDKQQDIVNHQVYTVRNCLNNKSQYFNYQRNRQVPSNISSNMSPNMHSHAYINNTKIKSQFLIQKYEHSKQVQKQKQKIKKVKKCNTNSYQQQSTKSKPNLMGYVNQTYNEEYYYGCYSNTSRDNTHTKDNIMTESNYLGDGYPTTTSSMKIKMNIQKRQRKHTSKSKQVLMQKKKKQTIKVDKSKSKQKIQAISPRSNNKRITPKSTDKQMTKNNIKTIDLGFKSTNKNDNRLSIKTNNRQSAKDIKISQYIHTDHNVKGKSKEVDGKVIKKLVARLSELMIKWEQLDHTHRDQLNYLYSNTHPIDTNTNDYNSNNFNLDTNRDDSIESYSQDISQQFTGLPWNNFNINQLSKMCMQAVQTNNRHTWAVYGSNSHNFNTHIKFNRIGNNRMSDQWVNTNVGNNCQGEYINTNHQYDRSSNHSHSGSNYDSNSDHATSKDHESYKSKSNKNSNKDISKYKNSPNVKSIQTLHSNTKTNKKTSKDKVTTKTKTKAKNSNMKIKMDKVKSKQINITKQLALRQTQLLQSITFIKLSSSQMKRLLKIHRIQKQMLKAEIDRIRTNIKQINNKNKSNKNLNLYRTTTHTNYTTRNCSNKKSSHHNSNHK